MARKLSDDAKDSAKPNLTPDTFLEHYRYIRRAKVSLDEASSDYRGTRKRAKAAGIDLGALALMEMLAKMEPEDAALRLKQLGYYASLANMPWGTQMDLFGISDAAGPTDKSRHEQALFDAEEEGRFAGAGSDVETANPYHAGTELFVAWDTGHRHGVELRERRIAVDGVEVRKPRGRPRKSGNPEDRPAA